MKAAGAYYRERVSRRRVTRRSTWFGGEGKAETQPGAPVRTGSGRRKTTRRASAPRRRESSVDHGRQHSLAHQASARLNALAAKHRLVCRWRPSAAPKRSPAIVIGPSRVRIIGHAVS